MKIKKILSFILSIAIIVSALPAIPMSANAERPGYYTYIVSKGKATITDVDTSISGAITVPSSLGGYTVVGIGTSAFANCSNIISIELPDGITNIGYQAFYNCSLLRRIKMNGDIIYISNDAFYGCSSLTGAFMKNLNSWLKIEFGNEYSNPLYAASINNSTNLYINGTLVTNLVIPDGNTAINNYCFAGLNSLKSINLPNSITSIGLYAFRGCSSLTDVYIKDLNSWLKIEFGNEYSNPLVNANFEKNRTNLYINGTPVTDIVIPDEYTTIKNYCFAGLNSLKSINLPDSITSIGNSAFLCCSSLTSIELPDSISSINSDVFCGCSSLTSIKLPNGITSIGYFAFSGCSSLTSIELPDGITSIRNSAFMNCSSLADVYIKDLNSWLEIDFENENSNPLYAASIKKTTNLHINGAPVTDIVIPDEYTTIKNYCFAGLNSLNSINLHNSITSIGFYAFLGCSSLTSINLPDSITIIGSAAFNNCSSLTSINLPDSITIIGSAAFRGCSNLTSIELPDSITSIKDYTFYGCSSLTSIKLPDSITSIGRYAFQDCYDLINIELPNSITSIGDRAFYGCSCLTDVRYTGSEQDRANISIYGSYNTAFTNATWHYNCCINHIYSGDCDESCNNCDSIRDTEIEHTFEWVIDMNNSCFVNGYKHEECTVCHTKRNENTIISAIGNHIYDNGCDEICNVCGDERVDAHSLEWIVDKENNCGINGYKHAECTICHTKKSENTIILPTGNHTYDDRWDTICNVCEGVREVPNETSGYYTYRVVNGDLIIVDCDNAISGDVTIPSTIDGYDVKSIEDYAFENCKSIVKVTIPNCVTDIGKNIFRGCSSLERISVAEDNPFYSSESGVLYNKYKTQVICTPENQMLIFKVNYTYFTGETAFDSVEDYIKAGNSYNAEVPEIDWFTPSVESIEGIIKKDTTIDVIYYENAKWNSGNCNSNISWVLYQDGSLIFSGFGEMPDYSSGNAPWNEYADKVKTVYIDPRITSIGAYAFENCSSLTFIDYGYSISSIGEYAFSGCTSLNSFKLPESVTSISIGAFYGCSGLKAVIIPDNITAIGDNAFYGCSELIQVTVGGSVTNIGDNAFANCTKLTQVYFRGNPATLGNSSFGVKTGKYVYYYSTVPGWNDVVTNGLWNGYTAIPYNAISKENFNGTNAYIIKVVDKNNLPLENAVVDLGGNVKSTNKDGMAFFTKPSGTKKLSVSCSNHITFSDSNFKASPTQLMDIIELSDRPSVVQGVRVNSDSIATSIKIVNCSSNEAISISVSGYSKYSILKYELRQGNRLIATQRSSDTSCTFNVNTGAFEEEETVYVKMYTSDGNSVSSALNIDVIKLADISKHQIIEELSNLDISLSLGKMGNYRIPMSFTSTGEETFYTYVKGRTICVGINVDVADFFKKKGDNASKSALQKMVDDAMKDVAESKGEIKFNVCGYIEIEYLGNGQYYVKTNYVKIALSANLSFNAQASFFGIIGVYFKASLSGESTLDIKVTRYEPESGFDIEDLNFCIDNSLSVEGGAYLLWGVGSASLYAKASMGFVLGIIPDVEFESVYISGEFGARWSVLWGLYSGKAVLASGDIYRYPEAQTYMRRLLSSSIYSAQQDPNSYEFNDRAYLENRSQWLSGEYLQKNIYDNVAPKIVTCGDTTIMLWLDDNSERDDANFQTLYYSVYENGAWSNPTPVADNGTFDCEFDVYSDGEKIYVVYTEMTNSDSGIDTLDLSSDSDMSSFASNVEVSVAAFENGRFDHPVQLTNNESIEILPYITMVDGELTVVWISTDSVELDGGSANNSVYSTTLGQNGWETPTEYISNQNTVSDVTTVVFNDTKYFVYIVDADGSSETKDDQVLVLCDENGNAVELAKGLIANVDKANINGKTALTWFNNDKIYMITEPNEQPICLLPENVFVGLNYQIVPISEEQTLFTFTMSNYDESGNSSNGTDIYGVYIDSTGCLTAPIRLTKSEGYVSNYSAAYEKSKLIFVFTETFSEISGENVETVSHLRNAEIEFFTDISLDNVDFDITDAKENEQLDIAIGISNNGTNDIDGVTVNFRDSKDQPLYTVDYDIQLTSGSSGNYDISITLPQSILKEEYFIEVIPKIGTQQVLDHDCTDNSVKIELAYADFSIAAEQKIIGENNYLILSVTNSGNVDSNANVDVYAPNVNGRKITGIETGIIAPGASEQYFVELNALTSSEDNSVSCSVSSTAYDPYLLNNTETISLLHIDENVFITDPEEVIHNPEISTNAASFDKYMPQDISFEITAEVENFQCIEGLSPNEDYTIVDNVITVNKTYISGLSVGEHSLKLLFDFGYGEPIARTFLIAVTDSAPIALSGSIDIIGDVVVGNKVYADISSIEPNTARVKYNWSVDGITVSTSNYYVIETQDYGKTLTLTVCGVNGFSGEFSKESTVTLMKPAAPSSPVIGKISSNSFAVVKTEGVEYSIDLIVWQDNNLFDGLAPNTEYTVYARKKATKTSFASDVSIGTSLRTKKLTTARPIPMGLKVKTYNTVEFALDSAIEYKIEGGEWTDNNIFTGLEANTSYTFYQRYKETNTTYASEFVTVQVVTLDRTEISGRVKIIGEPQFGETLSVDLIEFIGDADSISYQWYSDGVEIPDATQNTYLVAENDMGKDIEVHIIGIEAYKGELIASVSIRDYVIGDVNGDKIVDINDATILRLYVAKWDGITVNELAADVNNDGIVNIKDVTILRRYVDQWSGYEDLPYVI